MFKEKAIKGWICLLAIMLVAKGWAVAKEATQGTETQALKPKLIWEKDLSDLDIQQVSDLSSEGIKAVRASVKGLKVKPEPLIGLIVDKKDKKSGEVESRKVQVIMSDGEIKTIWNLKRQILGFIGYGQSASIYHGKYIKITDEKISKGDKFATFIKDTWITLDGEKIYESENKMNRIVPDGKMFYRITGPPIRDLPNPYEEERSTFTVSFYDLKDNLLWQVQHRGIENTRFSLDGTVFIVHSQEGISAYDVKSGKRMKNQEEKIMLKNKNTKICIKYVRSKEARGVRYGGVYYISRIDFFDKTGKKLWTMVGDEARISSDEKLLLKRDKTKFSLYWIGE